MRISDLSSDVCSSDLPGIGAGNAHRQGLARLRQSSAGRQPAAQRNDASQSQQTTAPQMAARQAATKGNNRLPDHGHTPLSLWMMTGESGKNLATNPSPDQY